MDGIGSLEVYRASYGANKFVARLPIWTAKGFVSRQQYTKIGENYKLPFLWRIAGNPDFHKRSVVFLRFVSCSLWISISLYSVFSHATSYKASQKMHIHTGYIWQAFLRSSYLGSEIICMIQYLMARIALVSLFSIVRFYCIGGLIGCQYFHTGWILNATSVNKLDTERKKWKKYAKYAYFFLYVQLMISTARTNVCSQLLHLKSFSPRCIFICNAPMCLHGTTNIHTCCICVTSLHCVQSYDS